MKKARLSTVPRTPAEDPRLESLLVAMARAEKKAVKQRYIMPRTIRGPYEEFEKDRRRAMALAALKVLA